MNFCKKCDNMYYLKISNDDGDDKLVHYCRNCGHENNNLTENICVYEADLQNSNANINLINEYTKYDNTLPRTTTIRCPNQKCPSNDSETNTDREILYIRNNDNNMDYVYLCAVCDITWKNK
tara:strand:+ start:818 stop:1183 length:366 start_codon:yes stop_codon:yes gene_type:complete